MKCNSNYLQDLDFRKIRKFPRVQKWRSLKTIVNLKLQPNLVFALRNFWMFSKRWLFRRKDVRPTEPERPLSPLYPGAPFKTGGCLPQLNCKAIRVVQCLSLYKRLNWISCKNFPAKNQNYYVFLCKLTWYYKWDRKRNCLVAVSSNSACHSLTAWHYLSANHIMDDNCSLSHIQNNLFVSSTSKESIAFVLALRRRWRCSLRDIARGFQPARHDVGKLDQ